MKFLKMEGLGNDFILTHEIASGRVKSIIGQAPKICDRKKGIGADGIILVLPSHSADFKMRIINSDGSEAEMCGNGIRCFARYVKLLKLSSANTLTIETAAGTITTKILNDDNIRVNMGMPVLDAPSIPVSQAEGRVIMKDLQVGDKSFKINAISMGNPHVVIYADDLTDELVLEYGKKIEHHPFFPKKTNVEFIKVLSDKEIAMRVWERGCGETLACGTGACASVVSGIINRLHGNDITVRLPGGELQIQWSGNEKDPVFMTGPARKVFEAQIDLVL